MFYKEAKPVIDLFNADQIHNIKRSELDKAGETASLPSVSVVGNVTLLRFSNPFYVGYHLTVDDIKVQFVAEERSSKRDLRLWAVWETQNPDDVALTSIVVPDWFGANLAKPELTFVKDFQLPVSFELKLTDKPDKTMRVEEDSTKSLDVSKDTVFTVLNGNIVAVSRLDWEEFFDALHGCYVIDACYAIDDKAFSGIVPEVFSVSPRTPLVSNDGKTELKAFVHFGKDVSLATLTSGSKKIEFLLEFDNPHPLLPSVVQVWPLLSNDTKIRLTHLCNQRIEGVMTKEDFLTLLECSGYELTLSPLYRNDCHFNVGIQYDAEDGSKWQHINALLTTTPDAACLNVGNNCFEVASLRGEKATLIKRNGELVVVVTPDGDTSYNKEAPNKSKFNYDFPVYGDVHIKNKKAVDWLVEAFSSALLEMRPVKHLYSTNVPILKVEADNASASHFASRFAEMLVSHNGETFPVLVSRSLWGCFTFYVKIDDVILKAIANRDMLGELPLTKGGYEMRPSFVGFSKQKFTDGFRDAVLASQNEAQTLFANPPKPFDVLGLTKGAIASHTPDADLCFKTTALGDGNVLLEYWYAKAVKPVINAKICHPQTIFCSWESALIIAV